jgi:hypothetical protein
MGQVRIKRPAVTFPPLESRKLGLLLSEQQQLERVSQWVEEDNEKLRVLIEWYDIAIGPASLVGRDLADPSIRFRTASTSLILYKTFALPITDRGGVSLETVFLGPSSMHEASFHALDILLTQQSAHPRNGLHASRIPSRSL